ncbi:hypothetical protein [Actinocorallia longicatena]
MNTLTVVEIPRPRASSGRPAADRPVASVDFRLTLVEELRDAGADDRDGDWLLARPRRSLFGRVLGRR